MREYLRVDTDTIHKQKEILNGWHISATETEKGLIVHYTPSRSKVEQLFYKDLERGIYVRKTGPITTFAKWVDNRGQRTCWVQRCAIKTEERIVITPSAYNHTFIVKGTTAVYTK